jgi:hypothetical protein
MLPGADRTSANPAGYYLLYVDLMKTFAQPVMKKDVVVMRATGPDVIKI